MAHSSKPAALLAAAAIAAVLAAGQAGQAQAPRWSFTATAPSASSATRLPYDPAPAAQAVVDGGEVDEDDDGIDPSTAWLSPNDGRVQVYADRPSVLPGQALSIHASTTARTYSLLVQRETATGTATVFSHAGYAGHDYRGRKTLDSVMHTARANWPVAVRIPTTGWKPGIYTVYAKDSLGRTSGTVFAVRTPAIQRGQVLFSLPVLDYQAYNSWGGFDFYTTPRAYQVSFDRPYDRNGGFSYWTVYDRWLLRWLLRHGYPLAFTTDYDLSVAQPATAPTVLVIPQHTEYVPEALFDWVDQHVNTFGDLNVAYFGANSFYWQVRLVPPAHGTTLDVLSYKNCQIDPMTATNPSLTTCRWRSAPVDRPESQLFGAMYSGIVDGGHKRYDARITADAPTWALAGTGWTTGTVLRGLLYGEVDQTSAADGGIALSSGDAPYVGVGTLTGNMTVRVSPAGARAFDAGTFLFGSVVSGRVSVGVSTASVDRFTRNVLGWLGVSATR